MFDPNFWYFNTPEDTALQVYGPTGIASSPSSEGNSLSSCGIGTYTGDIIINSCGIYTGSITAENFYVRNNLYLDGFLFDQNGQSGIPGQILVSNVSGVRWESAGIGSTGSDFTLYAVSAGTANYAITAGYAFSSGIATYSSFSGIATYSSNSGIATYSSFSGIATYSSNSGIATYSSFSGIATYSSFSGIATYSSFSGIATYSSFSGIATYSSFSGIATYSSFSGIATYSSFSGIATNLLGGIASQIPYQSSTNTTSYIPNGSTNQILKSNGTSAPSWTSNLNIGIVTAIEFRGGAFYGDGSGLTGIPTSSSTIQIRNNNTPIGTATTINFGTNLNVVLSSGIATVNSIGGGSIESYWISTTTGIHTLSNVGIGTTNPKFKLEVGAVGAAGTSLMVNGDARITGILSVGQGTITIDGNSNQIKIGTGVTITDQILSVNQLYVNSSPINQSYIISYTTANLGVGSTSDFTISAGNVFHLLSVTSSTPAWIRVFGTSSGRSSDTRTSPGGTLPVAGSEYYAELVTTSTPQTIRFSPVPLVQGTSGEAFIRVINTDNASRTIQLDFKVITIED